MNKYNNVQSILRKLESIANKSYRNCKYEICLEAIMASSFLQYEYNQNFTDCNLEKLIEKISNQMGRCENRERDNNTVFFFDGFGYDTRGLGLIYLKALLHIGKKVVYIVPERAIGKQKQIDKETKGYDFIRIFIPYKLSYMKQINFIIGQYERFNPAIAFFMTLPYDVAAAVAFCRMTGTCRYQINLTDHAFWIGRNAFDYCIEFRDYGYEISKKYRMIDEKKLIKLPFYPYYDIDKEFEGFPFIDQKYKKAKIIFSGGDLYKTISIDGTYYWIIEKILSRFSDVIFIYAGKGDNQYLMRLSSKFPKRVYHILERSDLFQVMKHAYLYLNTYPLLGGLMTQYAVIAGKLPITLKHEQDGEGILINQDKLEIFYNSVDELIEDVYRMIEDESYLHEKEKSIEKSVISPLKFEKEVRKIVEKKQSGFPVKAINIDLHSIRREYRDRFSKEIVYKCIVRKRNKDLCIYFPKEFICFYYKKYIGKLRK